MSEPYLVVFMPGYESEEEGLTDAEKWFKYKYSYQGEEEMLHSFSLRDHSNKPLHSDGGGQVYASMFEAQESTYTDAENHPVDRSYFNSRIEALHQYPNTEDTGEYMRELAHCLVVAQRYSGVPFRYSWIVRCQFEHCEFVDCVFDKVMFFHTTFLNCEFTNCSFIEAEFKTTCTLRDCVFVRCSLIKTSLLGLMVHNDFYSCLLYDAKYRPFEKDITDSFFECGGIVDLGCDFRGLRLIAVQSSSACYYITWSDKRCSRQVFVGYFSGSIKPYTTEAKLRHLREAVDFGSRIMLADRTARARWGMDIPNG